MLSKRLAAMAAVLVGFVMPATAFAGAFDPTSVFQTPIPAGAVYDPNDAAYNARLTAEAATPAGVTFNSSQYSVPIYNYTASTPKVSVQVLPGQSWQQTLIDVFAAGVPVPSIAAPAAGTDAHMVLRNPSTGEYYEMWKAAKDPTTGAWSAQWGGAMKDTKVNLGFYRQDLDWPGYSIPKWGATGTSIPLLAGLARIGELQAGNVPHALSMALKNTRDKQTICPAERTDGTDVASDAIPEGARLRLDPTYDASSKPKLIRTLVAAAQTYGIVVRDRTLSADVIYLEDPKSLTQQGQPDPYPGVNGIFEGYTNWQLVQMFPWDKLHVLDTTGKVRVHPQYGTTPIPC